MKKTTVLLSDNHRLTPPHLAAADDPTSAAVRAFGAPNGTPAPVAAPGTLLPATPVTDPALPVLLRHFSHDLLSLQEEERGRLARKLHDEVAQALLVLDQHLAWLKGAAGPLGKRWHQKLAEAQSLLAQTLATVQHFSRELQPTMLADLGLIPTLRMYAEAFARRHALRIYFTAFSGAERLGGDQKLLLYRVAQESLANVARHARADEVHVTLRKLKHGIRLEIRDNGQGFRPLHAPGSHGRRGLGLLAMQERVRLAHGHFDVESEPGQGTLVRAQLPYKFSSLIPIAYEKNHCAPGR